MGKSQNCVLWIQIVSCIHKTDDTYKDIAEDVETSTLESPSKYHLSINFLAEQRPYFPSQKSSKVELFSN